MCLNILTKKYEKPDPKERVAWKILTQFDDGEKLDDNAFMTPFKHDYLFPGVWKLRDDTWLRTLYTETKHQDYLTGFHCYTTRKEARKALKHFRATSSYTSRENRKKWKVYKVIIKGVTSEGTDGSGGKYSLLTELRNVVADEIKVIG